MTSRTHLLSACAALLLSLTASTSARAESDSPHGDPQSSSYNVRVRPGGDAALWVPEVAEKIAQLKVVIDRKRIDPKAFEKHGVRAMEGERADLKLAIRDLHAKADRMEAGLLERQKGLREGIASADEAIERKKTSLERLRTQYASGKSSFGREVIRSSESDLASLVEGRASLVEQSERHERKTMPGVRALRSEAAAKTEGLRSVQAKIDKVRVDFPASREAFARAGGLDDQRELAHLSKFHAELVPLAKAGKKIGDSVGGKTAIAKAKTTRSARSVARGVMARPQPRIPR